MIAYHGGLMDGHIVAGGRRSAPWHKGKRRAARASGMQELQKMKNSGNEAKKYLKTKEVTLFNVAEYVRFCMQFSTI